MNFNNNMNKMNNMNFSNNINMNNINSMQNMELNGLDVNNMINKFIEDSGRMDNQIETYYLKIKEYLEEKENYLKSRKNQLVVQDFEFKIEQIKYNLENLYIKNFYYMQANRYENMNSKGYKEVLREFKIFYLLTFIMTKTREPMIAGNMATILSNNQIGTKKYLLERLLRQKILENNKEIYFQFEQKDTKGNTPRLKDMIKIFGEKIDALSPRP